MPRIQTLIDGFNAGEFSEKLASRLSFNKYPLGAATLKNALPLVQGAFTRRPGTRYVAPIKDETKTARLIDFRFSTAQAYVLEFGEGAVRFYKDQGQITVPDTDAAISNGAFDAGITDWDDRSTGSGSISHDATGGRLALTPGGATASDIGWVEQDVAVSTGNKDNEHVLKFRIDGAPGDKIELRIGTSSTGAEIVAGHDFEVGYHCFAFTPMATTFYIQFRNKGSVQNKVVYLDDVSLIDDGPVEIDVPYLESELFGVARAQSADVLILTHQSWPVFKLSRSGHTSWSLAEIAWQDGPYQTENTAATTLMPAAASGSGITVTASATEGINSGDGFKSTDVGREVRIKNGSNWAWGVIVGWVSATQVTVDHRGSTNFPTTAQSVWRLGAWSKTTGFPCAVTFFEQRLVLAGTPDQPQTFWLSQSGDFENMAPDDGADTVEDDDALAFTIAARQVNVIRWLAGARELMIGTVGGEWLVKSDGPTLTPTDIDVKRQTTHGSAAVQPLEIGYVVLFLQAARRKLRELVYDLNVNGLRAPDLTILSDHATVSGVVDMAYQQEPQSTVWCVRADGVLVALTYERNQNVVGWSRHVLGGTYGGGAPIVDTVAVIPGGNAEGQVYDSSDRDEVWMIVRRTINGQARRYVEVLEGSFTAPRRDDFESAAAWELAVLSTQTTAFYVDCGLTYAGSATSTISGLDHLEGEEVAVLADGAVHPLRTVSAGEITLDQPAQTVQIGLEYTHTWRSLKLAPPAAVGTIVGQAKRIHGLTLVLLDSMGGEIGPDEMTLQRLVYREVSDAMDTAVPLFVGERFAEFDGDWSSDGRILIRGSDPVPFTCLAVVPELTVDLLR
jgi:hypothetical protein